MNLHDVTAQPSAVLLIGHAGVSEAAVAAAAAAWPGATIDLVAYGRAADDMPPPPQSRIVPLPARSPLAVAKFGWTLWRRRYDVAAVCQPRLELSRARGALLGLALASGAGAIVAIRPDGGAARRVSRMMALSDLVRFALLNVVARTAMPFLTLAARALAWLPVRLRADTPAAGGSVAYLRSDLDLAFAPLAAGGSLAHTDGILRALHRRPHDVELWATGELVGIPSDVGRRPLPTVLRANVPWEVSELLSGLAQTIHLLRHARPNAFVYQRYSLNNLAGVALARARGIPLVLEANASEVRWREDWSKLQFPQFARACEQLVLRHSNRIATVSENASRDLLAAGADPGRLRVVPNGVEVARFRNAGPHALPFDQRVVVIGFVGLFYPWHGARWLAEAFALVHRRRPDTRLLLVGDGEDAPLIRSILQREGLLKVALMTGMVARDDVPGYLAAADVLVSPHVRNDGFIGSPIKVWEYMASGRAIVASDVAQIGSVLRHRETALIVEPEDAEALAAALVELHDDRELRARLGTAAATEAAALHSWDARLAATLTEVP